MARPTRLQEGAEDAAAAVSRVKQLRLLARACHSPSGRGEIHEAEHEAILVALQTISRALLLPYQRAPRQRRSTQLRLVA